MNTIPIKKFLELSKNKLVIDVRTPAEYDNGHFTNAINIPVFSNSERAIVGTKYKKESRDTAIAKALEFFAAKTDHFLDELQLRSPAKEVLIYCWRGGFRSAGMGQLFQSAGKKVYRLEGGYKAYRTDVLSTFKKKYNLLVLGGMTGSGKTDILEEIGKRNEQVIDLEGLAEHKGSAFGALGQTDQPSIQQFENDLAFHLNKLNNKQRIWVEDESRMIGKVKIPDDFFKQIRISKVIKLEVPLKQRINRLEIDYAKFDKEKLITSIENIARRLGGLNTKSAIAALKQDDYHTSIDIVLAYYDKAYSFGLSKRAEQTVIPLKFESNDIKISAEKVIGFVKENLTDKFC
ncbi:MAG: tRNA 2-selenouridine(34) synthase MnmH [Candidatus Cloacimonetes bacterium]|nr:tRNA 2-selenouridine(34) synthase MnmH [Candidatus Cloacimonadota bacterium]